MKSQFRSSCLLLLLLALFFFNLNGQDKQVDRLYEVWLSSTAQPHNYALRGHLLELRDSSILLAPSRGTRVQLQVGNIGRIQFKPQKKAGRGIATVVGAVAGGLIGHLATLEEPDQDCTGSGICIEGIGESIGRKVVAIVIGAGVGGVTGHLLFSRTKIRLNGNYDLYWENREVLEKLIR